MKLVEYADNIIDIFTYVLTIFEGDEEKAKAWIFTPNPLFGDASPSDMITFGKGVKVLDFIKDRMPLDDTQNRR